MLGLLSFTVHYVSFMKLYGYNITFDEKEVSDVCWRRETIDSDKGLHLAHFHPSSLDQLGSFIVKICDDKPLLIFPAAGGDESVIRNIIKALHRRLCLLALLPTPIITLKMQINSR